jgi:hypothetical protein
VITRVVMSGYSGPRGTGRTRRIPEPEMGITELSWPARSPLPILKLRQHVWPLREMAGPPRKRLVGETRLGSDKQSEDQPCHGNGGHSGVE